MGKLRRLAIGVILVIVIGAPIVETFDQWDQTPQDGNDTEINLVIVSLCVAVALSLTEALRARLRESARSGYESLQSAQSIAAPLLTLRAPIPTSRPPTLLRV